MKVTFSCHQFPRQGMCVPYFQGQIWRSRPTHFNHGTSDHRSCLQSDDDDDDGMTLMGKRHGRRFTTQHSTKSLWIICHWWGSRDTKLAALFLKHMFLWSFNSNVPTGNICHWECFYWDLVNINSMEWTDNQSFIGVQILIVIFLRFRWQLGNRQYLSKTFLIYSDLMNVLEHLPKQTKSLTVSLTQRSSKGQLESKAKMLFKKHWVLNKDYHKTSFKTDSIKHSVETWFIEFLSEEIISM